MPSSFCRRLLASIALLATAACSGDPAGTAPDPDPGGGVTTEPFRVIGRGAVTERFSGEVQVRGTTAYTTTWGSIQRVTAGPRGNAIFVWDVADKTAPRLVDSVVVLEGNLTNTGDVSISDDGRTMVVPTEGGNSGSLLVFDLADPRKPRLLTRYMAANLAVGVHTAKLARVNGTLYAFLSVNSRTLVVLDLGAPAAPREVLALPMNGVILHDVFVRDGMLFTAQWDRGLGIWDIGGGGRGGTPAAPVELGRLLTVGGSVHNVWWFHDPATGARRYAFVGEEKPGVIGSTSAGDVHVVDVSDFASPREVAFYRVTGAGAHNFWMDEPRGILYAAYYNGGVRAIDVRGDLGSCQLAQRDATGRCALHLMGRQLGSITAIPAGPLYTWGVKFANDVLYASDMLQGLLVIDPIRR